ncbi:MAG: helix-turn-helix transcriptional regulator, partial [Bacteroidota bacterium]
RVKLNTAMEEEKHKALIQFETSTVSRGNEFLGPLLEAAKTKNTLTLFYQSFRECDVKKYTIHPLLLKEYLNRWYLVAYVPERKKTLTFGLERIVSLESTLEKFKTPEGFSAKDFFKFSIGISESQSSPLTIQLKCNSVVAKLIETQPVHWSQQILNQNEDFVVFQLQLNPSQELYNFILSFGADIEVLSPKSLRKEIAAKISEMKKKY